MTGNKSKRSSGARWPNHANDARALAMQAAKQTVGVVIKVVRALGRNDVDEALRLLERIHVLQVYIEETLTGAKYGEAPEPLPQEETSEPR